MSIDQQENLQKINHRLDVSQKQLSELEKALRKNQAVLVELEQKNSLFNALNSALEQITKVESLGGMRLLWGDDCNHEQSDRNKQHIKTALQKHETELTRASKQNIILQEEISRRRRSISALIAQQMELQEDIIAQQEEFLVVRKISPRSARQEMLPWSDQRKDSILFRAVMLLTLCVAALTGLLVPLWKLPETEKIEYIEVPERVARLLIKQTPPAKPVIEKKPEKEEKPPETPEEKLEQKKEKIKIARKVAENTGMLAFKDDFAELIDASSDLKIGAQATIIKDTAGKSGRYGQSGSYGGGGGGENSILTSQLQLAGSHTRTSAIQRKTSHTDASTNNSLKKVSFSHIESPSSIKNDNRQTAKTVSRKPARSDDEIQIVFDRYKDALYRIYNRELRKKPLLKGKLVLRLTIEASGSVSKCIIASSDLNAPELENKIIARVLKFNFGIKKGADSLTILYPIEFLPAS